MRLPISTNLSWGPYLLSLHSLCKLDETTHFRLFRVAMSISRQCRSVSSISRRSVHGGVVPLRARNSFPVPATKKSIKIEYYSPIMYISNAHSVMLIWRRSRSRSDDLPPKWRNIAIIVQTNSHMPQYLSQCYTKQYKKLKHIFIRLYGNFVLTYI